MLTFFAFDPHIRMKYTVLRQIRGIAQMSEKTDLFEGGEVVEAPTGDLRIEYMRLDEIMRDPDNPKDHDLGALSESLDRFGFVAPMGLNETNRQLLWGHGRLDDLEMLKGDKRDPPDRVLIDDDGMWRAPVVRGVHMPEREGTAYVITDNRQVELGGWNEPRLVQNLISLAGDDPESGLHGVGFSPEELDVMAGFLHGTMSDELGERYGEPNEKDFWPVVHVRVSPDTFTLFRKKMSLASGEDEAEKFHAVISRGG